METAEVAVEPFDGAEQAQRGKVAVVAGVEPEHRTATGMEHSSGKPAGEWGY